MITKIELAEWLHDTYEEISKKEGWETQEKCKVKFGFLPEKNKNVMIELATAIIERKPWQNRKKKRGNREIIDNIQRIVGINPDNYNESIHSWNMTKPDLIKLENAVKKMGVKNND